MAGMKLYGSDSTHLLSFRHSVSTAPPRLASYPSRVRFDSAKLGRLRVLSMAAKRNPKRLKYSAPRFAKEDELVYVEVDPSGTDSWKLEPVVELLKQGAVGVIPTDTVYAIVCHLRSHSAIERLRRIKNIEPSKPLSILCRSLRDIDTYTTGFPCGDGRGHANIFRAVKHCLPGPYTFILTASKELPKQCVRYGTTTAKYAARKNVGVRMPDDAICQAILEKMDAPLISTSVKWPKENEWMIDPVVIADIYGPEGLDFVVDGGIRVADPSTVVDMTGSSPKIVRLGKVINEYSIENYVMVVGALNFTESAVYIHFDQTPPTWSRFSSAVFRYSVERPDGSNACRNNSCSVYCELDGKRLLKPCQFDTIVLRNLTANHYHNFLLNVTTLNGENNSSAYSWFIDTIPPTANVSSEQNYTSAEKITIDITFSEACNGHGGFKCVNSSNCDVIVDGPAHVQPSSLRIIKPNIKYSLKLVLSLKNTYGRVVVRMAENFCKDRAGNNFTRSNASTAVIHFDRRPVLVDLWSSVPSYELAINGVPRTVFATNRTENLEVYLDFSIPIINSTEQILNALDVNSGSLMPVHDRTHGNRRFVFNLKNIASETEIITVKLHAGLLSGRTGTPISPVASLQFLYDCTKPGVGLSSNSPNVTKVSNINVIVEFTKPVFGFEASMIEVNGGSLIRFKELSRALYSLTVMAVTNNVVSISIPEGKVNDISGNMNVASNKIEMIHYSTPAISMHYTRL
ncbi:hypothetical protein CCACVL1_10229 [Corchorus capsularis]|uniref:Threonylcarbamoyl-AMP synthase n=1 Tax=Corchorus capsularis TaxID=210143 RepID=A0A1R3IS76_COCAP|nr:hypothetical protein CCACVL1_10229 [Corchorus capsularis]